MTTTTRTDTVTAPDTAADAAISARLRAADYRQWRAAVEATGGCAAPIQLRGSTTILDRDGAVLIERGGDVLAPCGNRRETVCPACSDRYAADAFHLLRAGLAGDDDKGVPASVTDKPRAFLTLTAPSFGPVHTRKTTPRGFVIPCGCGDRHHADDPRIGTARDPDSYDYEGAVLWQAHAAKLWGRFTTALRRSLAGALGIRVREFPDHARLSYAKVAEYQRRGLVHFHAVIRLDGPDGPADPCPSGLTHDVLRAAISHAAQVATITVDRPDGTPMTLSWGRQLDLRPIRPSGVMQLEDESGEFTDAALAGYIAKYATKGTGASEGADRPVHDIDLVAHLGIPAHHRRMIETAWELGGDARYEGLNLRRWAHMLGFRGHFLTKSHRYSITFRAIRHERRTWRLAQDLAELDAATDDPNEIPIDLRTVTVINDWMPVRFGHRDHAERELALAIAERNRQQRSQLPDRGSR
jgi:hypothetical protein